MTITADMVKKSTSILAKHPNRATNSYGRPGGLIDLSMDKRKIIVIGDLHGAIDNLVQILNHEKNQEEIKKGKTLAIIIGDGAHNDQTGQMREMQSSLLVIEKIIYLINTYPEGILYIRGNHDTFDERLAKSGILQGKEFRLYLEEHRSEKYIEAVEEFFNKLPMFIIGNGYAIAHAGPVRYGCTRQDLIDIEDHPDYYHQLQWNRLHEFRGNPNMKEYGDRDIREMLKKLGLPEELPFIVGHNPMWNTGNRTGIWRDIIGIKNHIILYSNLETQAPYLMISNGEIQEKFAIEGNTERPYV